VEVAVGVVVEVAVFVDKGVGVAVGVVVEVAVFVGVRVGVVVDVGPNTVAVGVGVDVGPKTVAVVVGVQVGVRVDVGPSAYSITSRGGLGGDTVLSLLAKLRQPDLPSSLLIKARP
jgi:hypothetical protein